ncbi:hypothetical protein SYNTR_1616 [Candidatus Syntrophocurvum alkaliphilum]|uniref:Uncharacterized protein n=1 Tax=Candidatus Syntrophocurvum alkaliphilum TaxID=2293317 RepID=A0A6I6DDK3_9FIRM|nr:hypothetical protein [Candidatus Syntrophocurvum alkaliphilum]QGU00210.1 hypothetical protein SYNTR_1616 [Candidatus Syntrophocurvum alkaliphilum]
MQIEKDESSILAYFSTSNRAQKALDELKKQGLVPEPGAAQIDKISQFSISENPKMNSPINNSLTLSAITLLSNESGEDGANPLLAAHDSASGIGNPNAGSAGGEAFMLTLVTYKENRQQAIQIIRKNRGKV